MMTVLWVDSSGSKRKWKWVSASSSTITICRPTDLTLELIRFRKHKKKKRGKERDEAKRYEWREKTPRWNEEKIRSFETISGAKRPRDVISLARSRYRNQSTSSSSHPDLNSAQRKCEEVRASIYSSLSSSRTLSRVIPHSLTVTPVSNLINSINTLGIH